MFFKNQEKGILLFFFNKKALLELNIQFVKSNNIGCSSWTGQNT